MRTALLCTSVLLPLAGCVNMSGLGGSSKYSCAAPEGVACDSMSGTYANAVHNNLPSQRIGTAGASAEPANPSSGSGTNPPASTRLPLSGTMASVADAVALRSQARVLRLWTKPWEDADGDLWDQGYVYVQVDMGRWQIDHVRQRIRDQYTPLRPPPTPGPTASANNGLTASAPSTAESGTSSSADGTVQRPSPFDAFPSLARPPMDLSTRSQ